MTRDGVALCVVITTVAAVASGSGHPFGLRGARMQRDIDGDVHALLMANEHTHAHPALEEEAVVPKGHVLARFFRHGRSQGNANKRSWGTRTRNIANGTLTSKGITQAMYVGVQDRNLDDWNLIKGNVKHILTSQLILVSPNTRAMMTLFHLAATAMKLCLAQPLKNRGQHCKVMPSPTFLVEYELREKVKSWSDVPGGSRWHRDPWNTELTSTFTKWMNTNYEQMPMRWTKQHVLKKDYAGVELIDKGAHKFFREFVVLMYNGMKQSYDTHARGPIAAYFTRHGGSYEEGNFLEFAGETVSFKARLETLIGQWEGRNSGKHVHAATIVGHSGWIRWAGALAMPPDDICPNGVTRNLRRKYKCRGEDTDSDDTPPSEDDNDDESTEVEEVDVEGANRKCVDKHDPLNMLKSGVRYTHEARNGAQVELFFERKSKRFLPTDGYLLSQFKCKLCKGKAQPIINIDEFREVLPRKSHLKNFYLEKKMKHRNKWKSRRVVVSWIDGDCNSATISWGNEWGKPKGSGKKGWPLHREDKRKVVDKSRLKQELLTVHLQRKNKKGLTKEKTVQFKTSVGGGGFPVSPFVEVQVKELAAAMELALVGACGAS